MFKSSTFVFIEQQLTPYKWTLLIGFIASCIYGIVDGLLIWLVKPLMDKGFIGHDYHFIHKIPLYLLAIFCIRSLVTFTAQFFLTKASIQVSSQLRKKLFSDLLLYPASLYDRKSAADFMAKINQQSILFAESATLAINLIAREGLTIFALLTVMILASPLFTLIYFLSVPLIISVLSYAAKHSLVMQKNVHKSNEDLDRHLHEVVSGHLIIKSFLGYDLEQQRFLRSLEGHIDAKLKEAKILARSAAFIQLIGGCVISLILFLSQSPFCRLSGGDFACLLTAVLALLRPLKQLSSLSELGQKVISSTLYIQTLEEYPKESLSSQSAIVHVSQLPARLEFERVSFSYPQQAEKILKNISFTLEPGQTVALVGPSGGGKTTLVSLVPRFYDYQGNIFLNDKEINSLSLAQLRNQIAFVAQDTVLFHDTVAANIAYGDQKIDWIGVKSAAKMAYADDFIEELPKGYLTIIGAGGLKLSGGQRQRLALARAFYKKASLLILDEATSALDHESQDQVQKALNSLMKSSSTLVIAHRLSTIIHADKILVLDRGAVLEEGTHDALINKKGFYAQLYQQSFQDTTTSLA